MTLSLTGLGPAESVSDAPSGRTTPRSWSGPRSIVEIINFGTIFPSAPTTAPVPNADYTPELREVQRHLRAGDPHRAMRAAQAFVAQNKWGRSRTAAWMVIGMLHREAGRHNLASEAFTKVRLTRGPLAPWGAYYEAEQDLARGKPAVAVQECRAYQKHWPDGEHADACQRIIARGYAARGRATSARGAAQAYDEDHDDAPIEEQTLLALAQWEVEHAPERAAWRLQKLWLDHHAPLTGRVAEELLAQLAADGVKGAALPTDTASLKQHAVSRRNAGAADEAWALFEDLSRRAEDDPALAEWVTTEGPNFGWWTRHYSALVTFYGADFAKADTAETSWNLYRAQARAAQWDDAATTGVTSLKKHAGSKEWRRKGENVARSLMLAKRYPEARDLFDAVAKSGGWRGRRARFFAAFSALMAGEHEDAVARFDLILEKNRSYQTESHYWRAQAHQALDQLEEAEADRAWVRQDDPYNWYAVLLAQDQDRPTIRPFARDGAWPGLARPPLPEAATPSQIAATLPVASWSPRKARAMAPLAMLGWPLAVATVPPLDALQQSVVRVDPFAPPASYRESYLFDESKAETAFRRLANAQEDTFPVIGAAYDLARAGLYDLSGPLFSEFYEGWREAWRDRSDPHHEDARALRIRDAEWRDLFLFARDHHHATRFTMGIGDKQPDPIKALAAHRYSYPLAHGRWVWDHGEEHGLDPYLVMGLMRQESVYDANAVSRAGARGAMQIMPRTGYLMADLAHDTEFTAGDLEDPLLSVERGVAYLGLLMRRFDGAYPLAVASYNGGPHNVSRFRAGTGSEMPIDAFVEHIPFRETRGYVKNVTRQYANYLALYTDDASIVLPPTPRGDHPEIVNF